MTPMTWILHVAAAPAHSEWHPHWKIQAQKLMKNTEVIAAAVTKIRTLAVIRYYWITSRPAAATAPPAPCPCKQLCPNCAGDTAASASLVNVPKVGGHRTLDQRALAQHVELSGAAAL